MIALGFCAGLALAEAPALATPSWHDGVTAEQAAKARALFAEARGFLVDAFYTRAVTGFESSLAAWDHPATHFMLAKALLGLDRSADALAHLWTAMRFGGHPLTLAQVDELEGSGRKLLQNDVGAVVAESAVDQPVVIAGQRVLAHAGRWMGLVPAGEVVVEVPGRAPVKVTVAAGTLVTVAVRAGGVTPAQAHPLTDGELAELQRAVVGFVVASPTPAERAAWPEPAAAPVKSTWVDPGDALPTPAAGLCAKAASADLATVCGMFAAEHRQLVALQRQAEAAKAQAVRRLSELTGAIVDTLE